MKEIYKKLSHEQIERGLADGDWNVRKAWAERMDYTPTPEQIERGLADEHEWVREAWARRMDCLHSSKA